MNTRVTPRTLRCRRCHRGPQFTKDSVLERTGTCTSCALRSPREFPENVEYRKFLQP